MFNKPIRTKGRNTFIRGSISEYSFQGVEIDIAWKQIATSANTSGPAAILSDF